VLNLSELLSDAEGIDDDGIERGSVVFWLGSDPDLLHRFDDNGLEVELLDSLGNVGLVSESIDDEDVSTGPSEEEGEMATKSARTSTRRDEERAETHGAIFSSIAGGAISLISARVVCEEKRDEK